MEYKVLSNGVEREDLFVVTKLWVQDHGYDNTRRAFPILVLRP